MNERAAIDRDALRAVGIWVHSCRRLFGLSQQQVARGSGVSQGAVSRIEKGKALEIPLMTYLAVVRYLSEQGGLIGLAMPHPATLLTAPATLAVPVLDETRAAILREFDTCAPWQRELFWQCVKPLVAFLGEMRRGGPRLRCHHRAIEEEGNRR